MMRISAVAAGLLLGAVAPLAASSPMDDPPRPVQSPDTVHVAPPMGAMQADRANVQAAFDSVQPGGTVLFAPGTYLLGAGAKLSVPDVTVLGHPDETVLRGCDPEAFAVEYSEVEQVAFGCTGLYVEAERQTIRGLTFEYTWHGIVVGPYPTTAEEATALRESGEPPLAYPAGGQRIEGNTFRATPNGLRVLGTGNERSVVRDNDFIDVFHAIGIYGAPLHFTDNRVTVAEPGRVPFSRHPGSAVIVSPGHTDCAGHVVAGNRIEGYPDPIYVLVRRGGTCHGVEIRDNTIHAARVKIPEAWIGGTPTDEDSTMVGTPITLMNRTEPTPGMPEADREGILEDILVQRNHIAGAVGLGILVQGVSRSRIAGNTIAGIQQRTPFPGITWDGFEQSWEAANGSGIWVSPGSEGNEIVGNTFEDVGGAAVFLEGDDNRVELQSPGDAVRDLGRGNEVTAPDDGPDPPRHLSGSSTLDPWPDDASPGDTVRYSLMPGGVPGGERWIWSSSPGVLRQRLEFRGSVLESRVAFGEAGFPVRVEATGTHPGRGPWEESFELRGDTARWSTPAGRGSRAGAGAAHYASAARGATLDLSFLARALLHRPDRTLPLLPEGEARLEALGRREVEANGRRRTVEQYAIHGLDLAPRYVWLDEDGAFFADDLSIRAGWEAVHPELNAASTDALVRHGRRLFGELIPPARERPLVIRGARLFDPERRTVREGTTIVVRGERITAVGPDGSVEPPAGAEVIEAEGRTVLPGLWDMHVHVHRGMIEELEAPLFLAAGVTSVRDLGSDTDLLLSLRDRVESGRAIGPRILPALIMYGPGPRALGASVGTPEEAVEAIDRFAALGCVQVKLYNPVPADLVPVIVRRARHHGMRVSGHIPNEMTGAELIESGLDELQHLFYVRVGAAGIRGLGTDRNVGARMAAVRTGAEGWEEFVRELLDHDVVVDPTLAVVEESVGGRPPVWLDRVLDRFPAGARWVAAHGLGPAAPPPMLREHWDEIVAHGPDMVRALHEAGVPLVAGTDGPIGGFELHRELELYAEAGIPPVDVLRLATLGAARVMGMDEDLGSVEPGKIADLILVDGDPTDEIGDIRRVVTVVKDGRIYDPAAIYRALGIEPCCEE